MKEAGLDFQGAAQASRQSVTRRSRYVDVLGCCCCSTYVCVSGLPRCFAGFPSQPCRVSVGCEEETSHLGAGPFGGPSCGAGGGQVLWLKPIEAALQRGQGTGGQPAAGTCFRSLPGVKRPRPSRVRWTNIPSRFISCSVFFGLRYSYIVVLLLVIFTSGWRRSRIPLQ